MPEYLAPGVYVEETSFRPKSIEGVSTSTCAFVGPTRRGPISGTPEIITSFGEFERMYGGLANLSFAQANDANPNVTNYMAHAVRSFFDNGGRRLYIGRTFIPRTNAAGTVISNGIASATIVDDGTNQAQFFARVPGSGGNGILRVFEKRSRATPVTMNTAPQGSLLRVGGTAGDVAQPAVVVGGEPPFALNEGDQLSLIVNGGTPQIITFTAADVQDLNAVTVAEINALIAAADPAIEVYASLPPSTGLLTLTTLDMIVIGQGSAYWTTAENYFIQYGQEYNFFGNGLADMINSDLVGQAEVTVVLDPSMFVSMAKFENPAIPVILDLNPDIQNYAAATYTCEGNTFTYQFDEYIAIWHRK